MAGKAGGGVAGWSSCRLLLLEVNFPDRMFAAISWHMYGPRKDYT